MVMYLEPRIFRSLYYIHVFKAMHYDEANQQLCVESMTMWLEVRLIMIFSW